MGYDKVILSTPNYLLFPKRCYIEFHIQNKDDDRPDTFQIQIWGTNGLVYDNGSQKPLGGGPIIVHQ
jgi:hypothetical protein